MLDVEEIKNCVQSKLSIKRFAHTIGVADEAKRLASKWQANESSAYLAGLIHDYAKEIPIKESASMLSDFGYHIDNELACCPALLHAPLASYLAKTEFGISDNDILNAVRYHTTGRCNMSVLEKIIYLADFIEPHRKFDGIDHVRSLAYKNLDQAVLTEANMVIVFNIEKNSFIHSDTINARNYLLSQLTPETNKRR